MNKAELHTAANRAVSEAGLSADSYRDTVSETTGLMPLKIDKARTRAVVDYGKACKAALDACYEAYDPELNANWLDLLKEASEAIFKGDVSLAEFHRTWRA